jgi:EAL domain-containing protein (putative c-di-GMP-specific phosphodiesterase class I)
MRSPIRDGYAMTETQTVDPSEDGIAHIRPYFQPIVESETGDIFGAEALLRMPGIETCDALFRRWESTGEVALVDTTMARRIHASLVAHRLPGIITLNVSALTVALAPAAYLTAVAPLAQVANRVIIEITETFPVLTPKALESFVRECKQLGFGIAFDDCTPAHEFCTPSALHRICPDMIKLDGAFVTQCYKTGANDAISNMITLARSTGALVVAEHIETLEMWSWARDLGAQLLQGYCFSPAVPVTNFPVTIPPLAG